VAMASGGCGTGLSCSGNAWRSRGGGRRWVPRALCPPRARGLFMAARRVRVCVATTSSHRGRGSNGPPWNKMYRVGTRVALWFVR
jgi:hypothetical protein